ncbi:MAG: ExbD/TolR family protein [Blastocatellia bacterium]
MNHEVRNRQAKTFINVTPLIDVLLVLLIIFMVISPMRPARFDARIPKPMPPDMIVTHDFALVVTLHREGGYKLNQQPAGTLNELDQWLRYALDDRPGDRKTVFVKAPRTLPYGEVVKVIDVTKAAGGAPIGLQIENLD